MIAKAVAAPSWSAWQLRRQLQAEAEAAEEGRARDTRPGGRLLGDHRDAGDALVDGGVHLLQERDGVEVLAAAVLVRVPLAVLARVVEVEHRRDRVDAQTIDVELVEPVQRIGDEEVAYLRTAVVEHVRTPVGVLALAGVGVLVERRAVEAGEGELVAGEVRRHPVDDDPDSSLVEPVDQVLEVIRVAEAARRRALAHHTQYRVFRAAEADLLADPLENRHPKLFFELQNLPRERGLADMAGRRRPRP